MFVLVCQNKRIKFNYCSRSTSLANFMFLCGCGGSQDRPVALGYRCRLRDRNSQNRLSAGSMESRAVGSCHDHNIRTGLHATHECQHCDNNTTFDFSIVCHANFSVYSVQNVYFHTPFHVWKWSNLSHRWRWLQASSSQPPQCFLRLLSQVPPSYSWSSGPLIKKNAPVSFATARAMSFLPVPGGPTGGYHAAAWYRLTWTAGDDLRGSSTSFLICAIYLQHHWCRHSPHPAKKLVGWMYQCIMGYYAKFRGVSLNDFELTVRMPPWTGKVSPLQTGWYARRQSSNSNKYNKKMLLSYRFDDNKAWGRHWKCYHWDPQWSWIITTRHSSPSVHCIDANPHTVIFHQIWF